MGLCEFGALTGEFYIVEIGTCENYGGKRGGQYSEVLMYCVYMQVLSNKHISAYWIKLSNDRNKNVDAKDREICS